MLLEGQDRLIFLGVDGGQSSTKALVGDAGGRVLGEGVGGPCNHAVAGEGRAKLIRAVQESVEKALIAAGLSPGTRFAAACFGMSGGPADKREILKEILPADRLLVTDDATIALAGAMAGGPGVIVIAGTGSIAFGRNASGQSARAGGWGYAFGDEGGAFDIVRKALRAALQWEEGWGPYTALAPMLLEATGRANLNEVLHLFYTPSWPRARIARLAAEVDRICETDPIALAVLSAAAQSLADYTKAVQTQLFPASSSDIAYIGGVFRSRHLLTRFEEAVGGSVGVPRRSPAEGALLEAIKLRETPR